MRVAVKFEGVDAQDQCLMLWFAGLSMFADGGWLAEVPGRLPCGPAALRAGCPAGLISELFFSAPARALQAGKWNPE